MVCFLKYLFDSKVFSVIEDNFILYSALIVSLVDRLLILLLQTKNLHNLPIPSLKTINFIFSLITVVLLMTDYYFNVSKSQREVVVFVVTLLNGIDIILTDILSSSLFFQPWFSLLANLSHILLFLYLGFIVSLRFSEVFSNNKIVLGLLGVGLLSMLSSRVMEYLFLMDMSLYLLFFGNLAALLSILLFSTTAILNPYFAGRKSVKMVVISLFGPLLLSFVVTILVMNRQLITTIVTASIVQTLNITIFREISGIAFSFQPFFMILTFGAIFLAITAFISIFGYSSKRTIILWLFVLAVLGFEIFDPFLNVIRLIAVYNMSTTSFGLPPPSQKLQ